MAIRPMHPFHRTELLVGGDGFDRLTQTRACVIGLGGVGSYAAEALVRSGVGELVLVDFDKVCITNVNRQLHATRKTVRKRKADLMAERAAAINPKATVRGLPLFYEAETADEILGGGYDLVLDCIDNMTAKVHLLSRCMTEGQYIVSAMGAGGRMDPTRIRVSDLSETHTDPFARIVRDALRRDGVDGPLTVVWSDEPPNDLDPDAKAGFRCICPDKSDNEKHTCDMRLQVQGTVPWMPAMFGLAMAGVAVNHLLGRQVRSAVRPPAQRMRPTRNKPSRQRKEELLEAAGFERASSSDGPSV